MATKIAKPTSTTRAIGVRSGNSSGPKVTVGVPRRSRQAPPRPELAAASQALEQVAEQAATVAGAFRETRSDRQVDDDDRERAERRNQE